MTPPVVLLGPQRHCPTVRTTLDELGADGPLAVISAGWEEREGEIDELEEHVRRPVRDLRLWHRTEEALDADLELREAGRGLEDRLRALQSLYRLRLRHAMDTVHELAQGLADAPDEDRDAEIEHALGAVHTLDQHHEARTGDAVASFLETARPLEREALAALREAVAGELEECGALAIAGGHVAVLMGRLQLCAAREWLTQRPVVAWSAGAMVLTDQVVLFHDSPPQGRGHAEVLLPGLGLCPGLVALPHARRRLLLQDALRVSVLARRFAPATCLALDDESRARWDGARWTVNRGCRWLAADGNVHSQLEDDWGDAP